MDIINQARENTTDIKDMVIRTSSKEFDRVMTGDNDNLGEIAEEDDDKSSNTSSEDETSSSDDMFEGEKLKEKEKKINEGNNPDGIIKQAGNFTAGFN